MSELSGRRVLVMDDDDSVVRLVATLLAARGYDVATALSVREAMVLLDAGRFDVVLADKNLPNVSGLELARSVRAQWPTTAVVLMTAFPEPSSALHATPIDGYLAKPFPSMDELPRALEAAIERRARAVQISQLQSTLRSVKQRLDKDDLM